LKKLNYFLLALILFQTIIYIENVTALDNPIVPINYQVNVKFYGEREFELNFPNGFWRRFSWTSGTVAQNTTLDLTNYYNLSLGSYCGQTDPRAYAFETSINNLLYVCSDVVRNINTSTQYINELEAARNDKSIFESDRNNEKMLRQNCELTLTNCQNESAEYMPYKAQYESCQSQLGDYNQCSTDLKKEKDSKSGTVIISALAGFAACYFTMVKKGKDTSSEQGEEGYYNG
jgi:hypothetical protein